MPRGSWGTLAKPRATPPPPPVKAVSGVSSSNPQDQADRAVAPRPPPGAVGMAAVAGELPPAPQRRLQGVIPPKAARPPPGPPPGNPPSVSRYELLPRTPPLLLEQQGRGEAGTNLLSMARQPQDRGRSGRGHQARRNETRSPRLLVGEHRLASTGEGRMWGAPPVEDPPALGNAAQSSSTSGGTPRASVASWTVNPSVHDGSWPQFLARCTVGKTITCPGCSNEKYATESALWSHISSGKQKCQGPPKLVLEQWIFWYERTFPSRPGRKRERDDQGNEPRGARWVPAEGGNSWRREAGFYDDENDHDSWHHIAWWDSVTDPGEHLVGYYEQNPCVEFPAKSRIRQQASGSVRVNIGSRQRTH